MADRKLETINLSGNQYAKVADRLKAFREDWPKSKIETVHIEGSDGTIEFTTFLWKDKTDLLDLMKAGLTDKDVLNSSADANGTARGEYGKKQKDFEKLESVSLGRALAMIGYLGSGEIASFEEMEEFQEHQKQLKTEAIVKAIETINASSTMEELRSAFMASQLVSDPQVIAAKDKRKEELTHVDS